MWYVIQVRTGAESKVLHSLEQDGYVAYLPYARVQKKHRRHKYKITKYFPLFPGYLFVYIEPDRPSWGAVVRKRHVAGFLGSDPSAPTPITSDTITALRDSESESAFESSPDTPRPGDPYTTTYLGHTITGTVDRVTKDAIRAVATFMGRSVTIERPLTFA